MLKKWGLFFCLSFLLVFLAVNISSADTGKVVGKVVDAKSKSALPGVTVNVVGRNEMVFTDEKGEFEIDLPEGNYTIRAEFLGFNPVEAKNVVVTSEQPNSITLTLKEVQAVQGEETVVTGERLSVPISRATASLSMVSSKKFETIAGADDAGAILKNTPGVQMESIGGPGSKKIIKLRGQGSPINSTRVLLLIDGVPQQSPRVGTADLSDFDAESIEKIEVMKGASSAIYGGNAQAGVINVITKKGRKNAVFKFDTGVSTFQHRTGSNQDWTQTYNVFHSWGGDKWDYTISGSYLFSKGVTYAEKSKIATQPAKLKYIKVNYPGYPDYDPKAKVNAPPFFNQNINRLSDTSDLDDTENYNFQSSVGVSPFKGNYLRVTGGYSFRHGPSPFGVFTAPTIILVTNNRRDYSNIIDDWEITPKLKYSLKIGLAKQTDIADMFFASSNFTTVHTGGYLEKRGIDPQDDIDFYGATGVPLNPNPFHYYSKTWSMDNSMSYSSDILEPDGNGLTIGQQYRWEKVDLPPSKNLGLQQFDRTPIHRKFTSLYFQDVQKFGSLNVNVGGRWEQITSFVDDWDDEFSPRVAINYEIAPGTSFRASAGRAFRAPEYSHIHFLGGENNKYYGNPNLKYETTWSYEMGLKFLTKYVSGDIAYFYSDYSDAEIPIPLLATNPKYIDLRDPSNLQFFKIYQKNREIIGNDIAKEIDRIVEYYTKKKFVREDGTVIDKKFLIENSQRGFTWVNRGSSAYQGFDTNFDVSNPWLPDLMLSASYLFTRAVAGNPNPFDFSQGSAPTPTLGVNATGGKRKAVPLDLLERPGERLVDVPTHTARVGASYKFPFGLLANVSGRFKSTTLYKTPYGVGGAIKQPEHWVWDLSFVQSLYNEKMKLKFAIENVFSKSYYEVGLIPSTVARYELGLSWNF